ncbi:MAG: hypothetical protein IJO46_11795, partial [Thermoguttaceae bacterium]|nr:hypothetical protein [Thermoguttaceae bacterium]
RPSFSTTVFGTTFDAFDFGVGATLLRFCCVGLAFGWRLVGVWSAFGRRLVGVWSAFGWRLVGVELALNWR